MGSALVVLRRARNYSVSATPTHMLRICVNPHIGAFLFDSFFFCGGDGKRKSG